MFYSRNFEYCTAVTNMLVEYKYDLITDNDATVFVWSAIGYGYEIGRASYP